MSRSRRTVAALALLLSVGAFAGGWIDGNPSVRLPNHATTGHTTSLRPASTSGVRSPVRGRAHAQTPRAAHLSGPIAAIRLVDLDGVLTDLDLPPGLDLSDPLPLPDGLFAELQIDLAGPATLVLPLTKGGQNISVIDLDTLTVVLDDPDAAAEAGAVRLDLSGMATAEDLYNGLIGLAE